jgi:hypothetical protein
MKKQIKRSAYQFYTMDWSSNGTNPLIVYKNGMQVDLRDEALFGVDVAKLGPAQYLDRHDDSPYYRIPVALIKKHIASGPFGFGFEENCKWIGKYLRGGK